MSVSTFDIFKVGIDPSGWSTAGTMTAARDLTWQNVDEYPIPYPFRTSEELFRLCEESGRTLADLMLENEKCWRSTYDIRVRLLAIARGMDASVAEGAATAQTRDAADVTPVVLRYYRDSVPGASEQGVLDFLLTAAAIGILYSDGARISGAGVGYQDDVGAACSMAAAGLAAVLGGSNEQIGDAVEIASTHNLVMSRDPMEGLVQIPGIGTNARGAIAAISAARMALSGRGHRDVYRMAWTAAEASAQPERIGYGTY